MATQRQILVHPSLLTMRFIWFADTPKSLASFFCVLFFSACNFLICSTSSAESFEFGFFSPLKESCSRSAVQCEAPERLGSLPLDTQSRILSRWVPRNKCSGLQHGGLSHLWQASNPLGIDPSESANAVRWANIRCLLVSKTPYPAGFFLPFQIQQEAVFSTFDQKSTWSLAERLTLRLPQTNEPSASCMVMTCELLGRSDRLLRFERLLYIGPSSLSKGKEER